MAAGTGFPIPGVVFTPACITVITGRCCSNISTGTPVCEDDLTEAECDLRPGPQFFSADEICFGIDACDFCATGSNCGDGNACTEDLCVIPPGENYGYCENRLNYDPGIDCCDSSTGELTTIDDGNACTIDHCQFGGNVSHTANPDCLFDADAYPKNRYVSFETGVITVDSAFHVRMTASTHFPASVGDLGWVGVPDGDGTALVVADPVFLPDWPSIVRVGDCPIVPGSTYEIRATSDGVNFDPPIVANTTAPPTPKLWGDIVGDFNGAAWEPPNGILNVGDVQAAILTFQAGASAAPLTWADVHPEVPNRIVNINDVYTLILAFKGEPYPFADPADCP